MWLNSEKVQNCLKKKRKKPYPNWFPIVTNETTTTTRTNPPTKNGKSTFLKPPLLHAPPPSVWCKKKTKFFMWSCGLLSRVGGWLWVGGGNFQYGGVYVRTGHVTNIYCCIVQWRAGCNRHFFLSNNCKFATNAACHTLLLPIYVFYCGISIYI